MKICLVNPPVRDFYATSVRRQPLGLLYIAAALRALNHDVILVNGHSRKRTRIPLPSAFSYLEEYMNHPDPEIRFPFPAYVHYGMSFDEMRKRIKSSDADMVMVSSLFTPYHVEAEELLRIAREVLPRVVIVAGGHHPTLHPDYLVEEGFTDFVITGEGEVPAASLSRAIESGSGLCDVPGIAWIEGGILHRNEPVHPDPDKLAPPERDLLLARDFSFYKTRGISLVAGRGCPNNCAFCTSRALFGHGRRCRDTETVVREIRECVERYGVRVVNFEDDNLFADKTRGMELMRAIINLRKTENIQLELTAMNGISLEHVDDEVIVAMKQAGFDEINLSLVSFSHQVQKSSNRPFDSERFRHIVLAAKKTGLHVRAYFILGLPDQTNDEIDETVNFLEDMGIGYFPSVYYDVTAPRAQWTMQRSSAFYNTDGNMSRTDLLRWFNRCVKGGSAR